MPILFQTDLNSIIQRILADIQTELEGSNPFLRGSFLRAMGVGNAGVFNDVYQKCGRLEQEMFPNSATTSQYIGVWANLKSITQNPATPSSGYVSLLGTLDTTIPSGTQLQSPSSVQYLTQEDATISTVTLSIAQIATTGTTAQLTTTSEQSYVITENITIAGTSSDYDGTWTVSAVLDNFNINFDVPMSYGTITNLGTISGVHASVNVESVEYGLDTNLSANSPINLFTPIGGVNQTGYVQAGGLTGGLNEESNISYRNRMLNAYQNPIAPFNYANIEAVALGVNGVTRCYPYRATPNPGDTTIFVLNDNDSESIVISGGLLTSVIDELLTILPGPMDPSSLYVNDPLTPVSINFVFTSITPDTITMQNAITQSLTDFFTSMNVPQENILAEAYTCAIYNTFDPATGDYLTDFTLSSPTGDVNISTNEIGVLGTVTFT